MYATQIYLFQRDNSDGHAKSEDHYDMCPPLMTMAS